MMGFEIFLFVGSAVIASMSIAIFIIRFSEMPKRIEPLTFQDSFDSFRLIPAPVEKSTAEWDTSFVDGLDDE